MNLKAYFIRKSLYSPEAQLQLKNPYRYLENCSPNTQISPHINIKYTH